jgi:hypothetical protein
MLFVSLSSSFPVRNEYYAVNVELKGSSFDDEQVSRVMKIYISM